MREKKQPSKVFEKCKTLSYENIHPFLIPFHVVADLKDVFARGPEDEQEVIHYFFDLVGLPSSMVMTIPEIEKLVASMPIDEKKDLVEHLPPFYLPVTRHLYSFFESSNIPSELPDSIPKEIDLVTFFRLCLMELQGKPQVENLDYIRECFVEDHLHMFKAYVDHGDIPLTLETYHHETLVHEAVIFQAKKILKHVLKLGLSPNAKDFFGVTPLFIAAREGYVDSFQLLMEYGANPKIKNNDGINPVQIAVFSGNETLLDYIFQTMHFKKEEVLNDVVLMIMIHYGKYEGFDYLFKHHLLDLYSYVNQKEILLDLALYQRNIELITKWITREDFDHAKATSDGYTFGNKIIMNDLIELIPFCDEKGIDIYQYSLTKESPLEMAVHYHADRFFDYFIEKGYSVHEEEKKILEVASLSSNVKVLRYLKEQQVSFNQLISKYVSPFILLSRNYSHEVYLEFIDLIDPTFHNQERIPLLIDPTFHNDLEVTNKLLEMGIDPNIPVIYRRGLRHYPIFNAVYHHNLEMVQSLVRYNANVNVHTDLMTTPLVYARIYKGPDKKVLNFLRQSKARIPSFFYLSIIFFFILVGFIIYFSIIMT